MSSLARRTLRATAAVAGIAAVGVGIAGPAVAAPELPNLPSTDGAGPAAPDPGAGPDVIGQLPSSDTEKLPQLFTVEGTSVYTADRAMPELLAAEQLPSADDVAGAAGQDPVENSDIEIQTAAPQDRVSAMQELDAASMLGGLTEDALGATEGNTVGD